MAWLDLRWRRAEQIFGGGSVMIRPLNTNNFTMKGQPNEYA
jgi:hypothetical protein